MGVSIFIFLTQLENKDFQFDLHSPFHAIVLFAQCIIFCFFLYLIIRSWRGVRDTTLCVNCLSVSDLLQVCGIPRVL